MDEYYNPPVIGDFIFSNFSIEKKIKNYDFVNKIDCQYFFSRYVCGGIALREGKNISLKKLMLIKQGVLSDDDLSQLLHQTIKNYSYCLDVLKRKELSVDLLSELNGVLTFNKDSRIRSTQNWVGSSKKNKKNIVFIPPPPDKLKFHLEDLILFSKRMDMSCFQKAVIIHNQFISIHPFDDGNGRLARVLFDFYMSKVTNMLPLTLFRLSDNKSYGQYLKRSRDTSISVGIVDYWEKAIDWCNLKAGYLDNCFSDKFLQLKSSFALVNLKSSVNLDDMLSFFLENPIVPVENFYKSINIELNDFQNLIATLLGLKCFKLWDCKGVFVIECTPVVEFFIEIESVFFKDDI